MRINFIRHAMTNGNKLKRYIGTTDESLCEDGLKQLGKHFYPDCTRLFTSPMKRCIQTAEIIYPNKEFHICDDFRECDFGDFENKNYTELADNLYYQKWIDSNGTLPFPNGENTVEFKVRCISTFNKMFSALDMFDIVSLVVHGGTIMSVLEKYAVPKGNYYDFSIKNAECLVTDFDGEKITILEKI